MARHRQIAAGYIRGADTESDNQDNHTSSVVLPTSGVAGLSLLLDRPQRHLQLDGCRAIIGLPSAQAGTALAGLSGGDA